MSVASKFNSKKGATFNYKAPEGTPYVKLNSLSLGVPFTVKGLYINTKGKFGDSPVAVLDNCMVNLPGHLTKVVKEIISDEEAVKAINEDKFGFKVYEYEGQNGKGFSVEWIDL